MQALGRCIRHKQDYGAIILLDERLRAPTPQRSLSRWLRDDIVAPRGFPDAHARLRAFFSERGAAAAAAEAAAEAAAAEAAAAKAAALCSEKGTRAESSAAETRVRSHFMSMWDRLAEVMSDVAVSWSTLDQGPKPSATAPTRCPCRAAGSRTRALRSSRA